MYFMMQTSNNDRPAGWKTVAIQCVASGVLSTEDAHSMSVSKPCRLPAHGSAVLTQCSLAVQGCSDSP
jgi:hypothetical protein